MNSTTSDIHGNFKEGSICCDNKSCQKVLYQWFKVDDQPDQDRASFLAYSVKTRLIFNKFPTNWAMASVDPYFVFSIENKYIGYILVF